MSKAAIIIGASSGIGAALAGALAQRGYNLGLMARREARLHAIAEDLSQRHGVEVITHALDVCASDEVQPAITQLAEELGDVELLIANAGIIAARRSGNGKLDIDRHVIETNLLGAIASIDAAVALFKARGSGHIVGVSSISAFVGIPGSAAYSASKAALTNYLSALRTEVGHQGICITAIHPGFVATDLAPDMDKYPFVASPEAVAEGICHAIERGAREAIVPRWPWAAVMPLMRFLPDAMIRRIF